MKELVKEHTDLDEKLRKAVMKDVVPSFERERALKPHNEKLYQAYLIMRKYGYPDKKLFA
ncbi:hypothetical protein HY993_02465 [Candidatus Micrarchaeota archaeon]|nr:hypothetical protein [Candidatus Micrarchaeota archaeon]